MRIATSRKANAYILYDAAILWDADRPPQISDDWFTAAYWRERDAIVGEAPGRGASVFINAGHVHGIDAGTRQWVLRPYRRGGLMARLSASHYVWTGAERTRAFSEFRLTEQLYRLGLPAPRPIGACAWRHGLRYEAALLTERIPGGRALADLLVGAQPDAELFATVGRMIRRFHDAGLDHVDLNARNILVDEHRSPWLIDFDRCRLRAPGSWQQRNLDRLKRSIDKFTPQYANRYMNSLLQGYETT